MNKVTEKGESYAKTELDRLKAIIDSDKVSDSRKGGFVVRVNILTAAFVYPDEVPVGEEKTVGDDGSAIA